MAGDASWRVSGGRCGRLPRPRGFFPLSARSVRSLRGRARTTGGSGSTAAGCGTPSTTTTRTESCPTAAAGGTTTSLAAPGRRTAPSPRGYRRARPALGAGRWGGAACGAGVGTAAVSVFQEALCESERARALERKKHGAVWALRSCPPPDWHRPLERGAAK